MGILKILSHPHYLYIIFESIWYLNRDIERCIIDYENRNEMLNWRMWEELLREKLYVVVEEI